VVVDADTAKIFNRHVRKAGQNKGRTKIGKAYQLPPLPFSTGSGSSPLAVLVMLTLPPMGLTGIPVMLKPSLMSLISPPVASTLLYWFWLVTSAARRSALAESSPAAINAVARAGHACENFDGMVASDVKGL